MVLACNLNPVTPCSTEIVASVGFTFFGVTVGNSGYVYYQVGHEVNTYIERGVVPVSKDPFISSLFNGEYPLK